jgi:undecaprenyl-diphosphatase
MLPLDSALGSAVVRLQAWDERVCLRANRALRNAAIQRSLRAASWLGDGLLWYALMLGLLLTHGAEAALPVAHMLLGGIACTLVYKALKRGIPRPRPYQVHASIAAGALPLDRFSFPSGHTLHAVAFTIIATGYYPTLAWLLLPFTLLTALSRPVLGLHYPSDVIAGAAVGALVALASFRL